MENSRIVESLDVRFQDANTLRVSEPFGIESYYEIENTFIYVQQGCLYFGEDKEPVQAGSILFIPTGKSGKGVPVSFVEPQPRQTFSGDYHEQYKGCLSAYDDQRKDLPTFLFVRLEAKVFNAVDLFGSWDVPPFLVKENAKLVRIMEEIREETVGNDVGKGSLLACKCKELVTQLLRHITHNKLFVQQIATNSNNLQDGRLIMLFKYINEHLPSDLSNKRLAAVARVSEDYVGQYFKTLTGINPQDYIEFQRMRRAVSLLRSTGKSVRDVGIEVGYKDSSYFCRRFKVMFGISAGRMRRRVDEHTTVA